ncbi:MAG: hypothetical protein KDK91_12580 [Gammaproteobacteria bacterium]|nr:hypothetical protein [Gammaproteobacteria bacterium]
MLHNRFTRHGHSRRLGLCVLGLGLAISLGNAHAVGSIKCWTNQDGVRECGNAVPPEYSRSGHVRKSSRGMTVEQTARAKTAEELRAEREEQLRVAREQALLEEQAREQAEKDQALLRTFTTEEDMTLAHRGKLAAIDSRITHTEQVVARLDDKLESLRAKVAQIERNGRKAAPALLDNIGNLEQQREEVAASIEERIEEKAQLESRYQQDLARYRSLKQTRE